MSYTLGVKKRLVQSGMLVCACSLLGGCVDQRIFQEQVVRTDDLLAVPGPFRPAVMRVHPLTHTELSSDGDAVMILHVELKDPWGDTVKGVGQLQVQLRKGGATSEVGNRGTRWDVDLRDIEINVSYFDSATRTYRVVIGGLPMWLADSVVPEEDVGSGEGARVRVLFRTSKADGEAVVLQDEYLMR
ncbi:MAG: hypothetical protein KUG81_09530 [Gammaproteobacteria bacterium]|nr:hypothetical protein [Gammaproteobacteria bacterium]